MIKIFSKQAIRFINPNRRILNKEGQTPGGFQVGDQPRQLEYTDVYFDTIPNTIQLAPDWIKVESGDMVNHSTFQAHVADGTLMEMVQVPQVAVKGREDTRGQGEEQGSGAGPGTIQDQAEAADQLANADSTIASDAAVAESAAAAEASGKAKEESAIDSGGPIKTRNRKS